MSCRGWRRRFRRQGRPFVEGTPELGDDGVIPLSTAASGCPLRVLHIEGDRHVKGHLEAMGFTPGEKVILWTTQDPLVALIRGSKVALSRRLAEKIRVKIS